MTSKTGNQLRCHKGLIPSGKKLYPDRSVHGIYFPSKGVRYIAINDNVDTINGESELAPFLNILNEMHARQTSKRSRLPCTQDLPMAHTMEPMHRWAM